MNVWSWNSKINTQRNNKNKQKMLKLRNIIKVKNLEFFFIKLPCFVNLLEKVNQEEMKEEARRNIFFSIWMRDWVKPNNSSTSYN
jgi:hypothetical protein